MYRKPRWVRRFLKFQVGIPRSRNLRHPNLFGYLLSIVGGVIILTVLPVWLYLFIIGVVLIVLGVWILQGK